MSEREDIIRGGETEYPPEEGPSSEWPSVISPTTNHDNDSSNITPNLVSLNEGTTNTESVRSGSLDFNLDLDDDDALDEELESPTFDLEPFIEEFQIADQFQNTLPVPTYNPLDLNTKPSEVKRRLIPLKPSQSDTAKDVRGTQRKNGHIFINEHNCLPKDWAHAPTGIGLRFRIQGGCASRRIIIQLLVHQDSKLVFTPSFEIHPCHVKDFSMKDRSINEAVESKIKQKRKDDFVQQESYVIFAIGLHSGGVGFGLDYNAKFLTMADRQLLWYLRRLSVNYPENDSTPQRIIFRINARWIDYEETESNSNVRRKIEARDRLYAQIEEFEKDAAAQKQIFSPYRSQQDVPVTQWGQFVPRQTVAEESPGLVAFRARASFSSLHEYQITLAYASHLEWEREREIADFVSAQWHGVAFILVNKSTVLALLKLNMPKPSENGKDAFNIEHWAPREGNTACISFRPPNKLSIGNIKCYGICTANVFDLPYPSGTLFHIVAQNVDFYAQFAVGVGKNLKFLPARLFLDVPISGAKRQVDAINRLCKPEPQLARFSTLLLNRNYQQKRKRYNDPLDSLEISDEVIKNAINVVTSVEGITWSSSQLLCLQKHVRNFPNDLLIIQGYPGTGKTLTLIGLASIYRSLGLHVIMTAPTHFAADAICEGIQKWERLSGTELKPLRVYRPLSESGAFRNYGKSFTNLEGDTVSQDEGESLSGGKDETILPTTAEESTASVVEFPSNSTTIIPESKPEISPPAASEEGTTPIVKSPSNGVAIVLENKPESTPTTVSGEGTVAPMIEPPSGNALVDPEIAPKDPPISRFRCMIKA
ncbi:uncharacterized protein BJX67DRAFT_378251 [Aspergillus lucknowensis]|uniref:DNA2/NAM7 helicase helicase domain-containing protein n=1 Tax=Aspergillus lucknowensis TaxID=176173 RepID=A0ABR4M0E4_9EURO